MRPYVFAGLAVCAIASSLAAQQTVDPEVRILPGSAAIDTVAGVAGAGAIEYTNADGQRRRLRPGHRGGIHSPGGGRDRDVVGFREYNRCA